MRYLIFALFVFTQCKISNPPQQPPKIDRIAHGHYIIRTKYMCDGKVFVPGSFSNYEVMGWPPFTPEEIKAIKEDDPFDSNTYIWKVGSL